MLPAILQQLLRSRAALLGALGGGVGLTAAAAVRLIPWGLFFLILLLAIVGVVAFVYLRQWWGRRKDAAFAAAMDEQGQRAKGQVRVRDRAQVEALQAQWKAQFAALQRSRVGRERRFVYFLPWYVIIGAPACGKSTAIGNSGLRFPMGQPKLGGTGGTKNCDWWFAEDCILLDTAGRYTFNDENEPDRAHQRAGRGRRRGRAARQGGGRAGCLRSGGSRPATGTSRRSKASTSTSRKAGSPASSGPTGPGRRRS